MSNVTIPAHVVDGDQTALAAARACHRRAERIWWIQFLLVLIPAVGAPITAIFFTSALPYAAAVALLVALVEHYLEKQSDALKNRAALLNERYDCDRFGLPWSDLAAEEEPSQTTIADYAAIYDRTDPGRTRLVQWYPKGIEQLPLRSGVVAAQRVNIRYNLAMMFWGGVLIGAVLLLAAFVLVAIFYSRPVSEMFGAIVGVQPLLLMLHRLKLEHSASEQEYQRLNNYSESLWKRAVQGATGDHLAAETRRIQDELFDLRSSRPIIFNRFYRLLRNCEEAASKRLVEMMMTEWNNRPTAAPASGPAGP